jgi:hypothetical protein
VKLPSWLRVRSTTRVAGKVTVTLTADTTGFEAAMRETASIVRYQQRVAHERSLGLAYVGVQLDELARSCGMDPVQAWRLPRAHDQRVADLNHPDRDRRQAAEAAWLAEHRAHRAGATDG